MSSRRPSTASAPGYPRQPDNAVQERFRANSEFAAAIGNEIPLFAQAAATEDEAEDLSLTFEGSGQWLAYRWRTDTRGGGAKPADVLARFSNDSQWSQAEGFALVLALDRFIASGWTKHAFGDGARTVLELLDAALAE